MKSSFLLALTLLAVPAFAAEPADDVKAAAKKLADAPNYSWSSTTAVPEGTRFQPGSVEGKSTKGGVAHLVTTRGDRTTEQIVKAGKSANKTETGWKTPEELRAARPEGAGAGGGGGGGGQGGGRRGGGGGFGGFSLENFKAPAEQVEALVAQAKDLKKEGDAVSGALTEEAVKAQLAFGGGRRGGGGGGGGQEPPAPTDAKGSVKFWLKDGALAKYEVHVEGKFSFNGNDMAIDRTTTTEIKNVGTTKIDVPEEAIKKLDGTAAPKTEEKKSA